MISASGLTCPPLRILGDGLAWAPGSFFEQDGTPVPACSRGTPGRIEAALAEAGIEALVGHEIEFLLVNPTATGCRRRVWAQYGLAGVLEHEAFVRDVIAAASVSGVAIEQFHPEYGANQFEISLTPQSPVAAVDQLVLTRIIVGRIARRYGLRVSLSPAPFVGKCRMRCPPTLLTDQLGRAAVLRRSGYSRYDEQG